MVKPAFCKGENKDAHQLRGKCTADPCICFFAQIVHLLSFLNPKFQASSLRVWLYSLVGFGPGRKLRRQVYSQLGSNHGLFLGILDYYG